MKKFFAIFTAMALIFGIGSVAMAAFDVRTAITSEPITGTIDMCEKYGAVTWTFSTGARIYDGDWMFFDLPRNVELCQTFNFVVLATPLALGGAGIPDAVGTNGLMTTAAPNGTEVILGPWKIIDKGTDGAAGGITVNTAKGLYAHVYGQAGTRRVNVAFYDDENATPKTVVGGSGLTNQENRDGDTQLTVNLDTELTLTLFNGEPWNGIATIQNPNAWLVCVKDNDNDGIYGDQGNDTLQNAVAGNIWDNYICGLIRTAYNEGDRINVSFDSGGISGDDFLTFQGQREIAHIMGAQTITLEACSKRDLCGYVSLAGGQGAVCSYQYDAPAAMNYCPDTAGKVFMNIAGAPGNRMIIKSPQGFGNLADTWYYELEIVSGDGTYFAGTPTASPSGLFGFLSTNGADLCTAGAMPDLNPVVHAPWLTWTPYTRTGAAVTGFPTGIGCGTVGVGQQITKLRSPTFGPLQVGAATIIDRLLVDVPNLIYVPSLLTNGAQATVRFTLYKAPCGKIFSGDRCVANYVTSCAAAQPATTLIFPYAVELDGSSGWWFGMSFCNPSAVAGTAIVNVFEDDGDKGTYTTPSIAAGDMVTFGAADLLASLTPAAGNTGTLGDARCHIVVTCNFGSAAGFGMMGNGLDSTGYAANGVPGNAVAPWNY